MRRPRGVLVGFALAVALGSIGCASTAQLDDRRQAIASLAADTTPFQATILEDGVVTEAEYESAVLAARTCVQGLGLAVGGIQTISVDGDLGFVFGGSDDPSLIEQAEQCFEEYVYDVGMARHIQNAPTESEMRERVTAFSRCLTDAGYTHEPAPVSRDEATALSIQAGELGVECLIAAGLTVDLGFEHDIPAP